MPCDSPSNRCHLPPSKSPPHHLLRLVHRLHQRLRHLPALLHAPHHAPHQRRPVTALVLGRRRQPLRRQAAEQLLQAALQKGPGEALLEAAPGGGRGGVQQRLGRRQVRLVLAFQGSPGRARRIGLTTSASYIYNVYIYIYIYICIYIYHRRYDIRLICVLRLTCCLHAHNI